MLSLKLGLSLNSSNYPSSSAWSPTDESSLEAWYQKGVGVTEVSGKLSAWSDSSTNSKNITQTSAAARPDYSNGVVTFTAADNEFLNITPDIDLSGEFTIGIKAFPTAASINHTLLGHSGGSTEFDEFIKYATSTKMTIRVSGSTGHINLVGGEGTFGDNNLVLTRDSSNVIRLHKDGTLITDSTTLSGTISVNIIGNRGTGVNDFEGNLEELQFFSSTSSALTANVNARLAGL